MTKGKKTTTRESAPTKAPGVDVEALLAERRKYEDWIAALEAKKEQTPAHVFTRVHGDYQERLKAATDKLAAQSGSLGLEKSRLEKRIAELDLQIHHREDERAEIELRAHVGEMSDDDVEAAQEEADEELEKLNATRTAALSDFERLSELLSSMSGGAPKPASAPEKPVAPAGAPRKGFDELSFLQSVVGAEGKADSAPAAPPRPSQPTAPARSSQPVAARVTVPSLPVQQEKATALPVEKETPKPESKPTPPPAAPARPSVAMEASPPAQSESAPRVSAPVKAPEPPPPAPAKANTDPMMFNPKTAGGVKNLKCKACGTMNDPKDWYCVKCAAELSVV